MNATLEYIGHTLIVFDDHSYRWFSVKRFAWGGAGDNTAVLTALIGHRRHEKQVHPIRIQKNESASRSPCAPMIRELTLPGSPEDGKH